MAKEVKTKSFDVRIIDKDNNTRNINIHAFNADSASNMALSEGSVLSVKRKVKLFTGVKLTSSERFIFLMRLSTMLSSKLGAGESLRLMQDSFTGNIREVSGELLKKLESTDNFGQALEEVGPAAFPSSLVALVKAGELGGDTGDALREAANFEQELNDIKQESGKGMGSAIFGFLVAGGFLVGSSFYMGPKVKGIMESFPGAAPDTSMVDFLAMVMGWGMLVIMVIFLVLLFLGSVIKGIMPNFADKVILMIPFYRDLILSKNSYSTLYGLSMLINSGVNIEESLRITRDNAPKGSMKTDLNDALNAILEGEEWPDRMSTLHDTDKASLKTSSDKEQIAKTLHNLSFQYRRLYSERIKIIIPTMQLITAMLLSVTGSIMFGQIIMPMLQLTQSLA